MAHQKDINIVRLKELVATLKVNRKEKFNLVEINHRFTATQLKSFATIHGGIRNDRLFLRLVVEAMFDELLVPAVAITTSRNCATTNTPAHEGSPEGDVTEIAAEIARSDATTSRWLIGRNQTEARPRRPHHQGEKVLFGDGASGRRDQAAAGASEPAEATQPASDCCSAPDKKEGRGVRDRKGIAGSATEKCPAADPVPYLFVEGVVDCSHQRGGSIRRRDRQR